MDTVSSIIYALEKKKNTVTLHNGEVTERKLVFSDINDREYCISILRNTIRLIELNMYDTNALVRDKHRIAQAINTLKDKAKLYKLRLNQILNDAQRQREPVYWATLKQGELLAKKL